MLRFSRIARCLTAGLAAGLAIGMTIPSVAHAAPVGTQFTYQGELVKSGALVNGNADVRVTVFDALAGGSAVTGTLTRTNVPVANGVFSVSLDFGTDIFATGEGRFLQIEVRSPAGSGSYVALTPRQPITAAPYAQVALGGAGPFEVRSPSTTDSAVIDATQIRLDSNLGQPYASVAAAGPGGLFRTNNLSTFANTSVMGTSLADGGGFIELFNQNNALRVLLEANSISTGAEAGYLGLFAGDIADAPSGSLLEMFNGDGKKTIAMQSGGGVSAGLISLYNLTGTNATVGFEGDVFGYGGGGSTFDENGAVQISLEPDFDGLGGFLTITNPGFGQFATIQTNLNGSSQPGLDLVGSLRSFNVRLNSSGNASVSMPSDAVSALEIMDEPGVANAQVGFVALTTSMSSVVSRTITVPAAGFVLALFDGDCGLVHTTGGGNSFVEWIIDDAPGGIGSGNDDMLHQIPSGSASGTYDFATSSHALFAVPSAGSYTYHVNMRRTGTGSANLFDGQFTLLYVPTAYGTTTPSFHDPSMRGVVHGNDGPTRLPQSAAEINAERARGEQQAMIRMQSEMLQMRQEVEELRRALMNDPNIASALKAQAAQQALKPASPAQPAQNAPASNVPADAAPKNAGSEVPAQNP